MSRGFWTCQRVSGGIKCGARNANRRRKCMTCGKPRPARKRPAHMSALALPYDYYIALNGGERCGICGAAPKPGKKLHRDHEHVGVGFARGALCFRCNAALRPYMTLEWLRAAVAYLERANTRRAA
jgi:hypothetical protein